MKHGAQEMAEVLTTAQIRGVEQAAMAAGAVDGLTLMERAGEAVVAALRARWPELEARAPGGRPLWSGQ